MLPREVLRICTLALYDFSAQNDAGPLMLNEREASRQTYGATTSVGLLGFFAYGSE